MPSISTQCHTIMKIIKDSANFLYFGEKNGSTSKNFVYFETKIDIENLQTL